MAKGNFTRGAARSPNCGFQKGHPPYYTGGSVKGHAPTSDGKPLLPYHGGTPNSPARAGGYLFNQPLGMLNQAKGGGRPKDKERRCVEALENGADPGALIASKSFPKGMVLRLSALVETAQDPTHRDFMNAQRMVRDIRMHLRGGKEELEELGAMGERTTIEVIHGRVDVPLPGRAEEEPSESGA